MTQIGSQETSGAGAQNAETTLMDGRVGGAGSFPPLPLIIAGLVLSAGGGTAAVWGYAMAWAQAMSGFGAGRGSAGDGVGEQLFWVGAIVFAIGFGVLLTGIYQRISTGRRLPRHDVAA